MITSVLIIAFSVVFLVYWFRYCCILLIRTHSEQQLAAVPACDGNFNLGSIPERMRNELDLDTLRRSLDRDYALFSYLLEHAAGLQATSLEDRLLVIDYKVMQGWYSLTRTVAPQQARAALEEMATVLGLLVGKMGERAAAHNVA
jgi:hypothetical protein